MSVSVKMLTKRFAQAGLNDQSSMENEYAVSAVLVTGVSTNGTEPS